MEMSDHTICPNVAWRIPSVIHEFSLCSLIFVLALLLQCGLAIAQTGQAQIVGTITDSSGAVIPKASVSAVNERNGAIRTAEANERGYFVIPGLQPSTYTVKASSAGFAVSQTQNLVLATGQSATVNLVLKPAGSTETITVSAAAEATVDTTSARIGANVNQLEVANLPLNGRQLSQLYLQAPGAVNVGTGSFFDIRFSGRSNEQNAVRYDGIEGSAIIDSNPGNLNGEISSPFRLQLSLENVQEFRVDSSQYTAEYGTGSGGQISVSTKSGSNQFHGALFEYLRNDKMDAGNYFDRAGKSPLRLNQFGASVGGPIKKDKAFFFGYYEGYRLRSNINIVEAAPSAAAKARAVPAVLPLVDAFHGPGAVLLPGKSTNSDYDIYQLNSQVIVNENSGGMRLDYRLSDRFMLYTRYFRDQGRNSQPEGITGRRSNYRAVPQNAIIALNGAFTPRVFNEVKVGFNEALTRVFGTAPTVNGIDMSMITINTSGSIANTGIAGQGGSTGLAVPGGLIRGTSAFNGTGFPYTPYTLSFIDNLNWVKGNHSFKFGGEFRRVRMYTDRLGGTTYSYSNLAAFLANTTSSIQYAGNLSDPSPFNSGATGERLCKTAFYIGYAQDEWRLQPNLTLSYGLRYEYYAPMQEANNWDVRFDINTGTLLPANTNFYTAVKTNFGPRIGLAWSPKHSGKVGKTAIRAGFGMFYGPGQLEDQVQTIESDRIITTQSQGSAYPINIDTVRSNFISNPNNRSYQPRAYSPDYRIPERIYQYSFSIQQELPYKMSVTAAYVGSQGTNLFLRNWTNKITQVLANGTVIRQFDIVQSDGTILRPYAEIDYKTSGGWDTYNAAQLSLARRFSSGLTLNSQYTFAKSYGNTSGSNDALTSGNGNISDYSYDQGYNNFDVRHAYNLSAVYALPFGAKSGGAEKLLLKGWEIGTILNARSGLPIDLRVTRPDVVFVDAQGLVYGSAGAGRTAVINTLGGGSSRNVRRPDVVPGVDPFLYVGGTLFLNPAAFAIPKPGTSGNLMRNALHGPSFRQLDFVVHKRFLISETQNVEFRAEFFNILNKANFSNPVATLPNALGTGTNQIQPGQPFTAAAAGTFGTITQTVERTVGLGTQRQIQFALRFNF
jgi:hypothetical protein